MIKLSVQIVIFFLFQLSLKGQVLNPVIINPADGHGTIENLKAAKYNADEIKKFYYVTIASPKDVINGKEYVPYFYRSKTTPLLFSELTFSAMLSFNSRNYTSIKLQYDTFLDEIIYRDTSRILNFEFPWISLNKDLVEGFSFYHDGEMLIFRHLKFPSASEIYPDDGYYEIAYDGPSMFIIKHRSSRYTKDALTEYKYTTISYILIDGTFKRVTNLKDFMPVFGEQSPEVTEFLQKSKIKIRKANKKQIAEILQYYDSLPQ